MPANWETRDTSSTFTFDKTFWVNDGHLRCTSEQKDTIIEAIEEARGLTNQVIKALSAIYAEKSPAYLTWFGKENSTPEMRKSILEHNFRSLLRNLRRPELAIKINGEGSPVPSPATAKSLIYACDPAKPDGNVLASTLSINSVIQSPDPTYVLFNDNFFTARRARTLQEVAKQWKDVPYRKANFDTRSLTLIHEFQHMYRATGPDRYCTDVRDPAYKTISRGCYSIYCCRSLPDNKKIVNAENFAFIAAYIYTWPETAKISSKYRLRPW
ncbi:hypothetical protein LY76DRAFT_591638 [Colletotrichum caudatum]|nr:hypothetical protein LY76DRAFT_591638 [Colletotrichum caudatum]